MQTTTTAIIRTKPSTHTKVTPAPSFSSYTCALGVGDFTIAATDLATLDAPSFYAWASVTTGIDCNPSR